MAKRRRRLFGVRNDRARERETWHKRAASSAPATANLKMKSTIKKCHKSFVTLEAFTWQSVSLFILISSLTIGKKFYSISSSSGGRSGRGSVGEKKKFLKDFSQMIKSSFVAIVHLDRCFRQLSRKQYSKNKE